MGVFFTLNIPYLGPQQAFLQFCFLKKLHFFVEKKNRAWFKGENKPTSAKIY
jgi:hypothetical protein